MNQTAIGSYIARKRKEQNLTQEQLAEQLGVSNKTVSKWENGKCMPDYSIIQTLCEALHVTLPELMDGEDAAEDSVRITTMNKFSTCCAAHRSWSGKKASSMGLFLLFSASPAVPCPRPPEELRCRILFLVP